MTMPNALEMIRRGVAELPITMLACARLGVIHSVVFGGFSGEACGLRAADSGSRVLIYMDGYYRSGKLIDHKAAAEIAIATAEKEGQKIDKVLVWRRYPGKYCSASPMVEGRDYFVDDVLKKFHRARVEPVPMDAEAPLFLMYTSGTTGKPKGVMLTHRNFTTLVAKLSGLFDLGPGDGLLSVLPLHHTFEFTCGLILPFSRGARVAYLDELNGDRIAKALKMQRATAMVGVPALWQLLERRILQAVLSVQALQQLAVGHIPYSHRAVAIAPGQLRAIRR